MPTRRPGSTHEEQAPEGGARCVRKGLGAYDGARVRCVDHHVLIIDNADKDPDVSIDPGPPPKKTRAPGVNAALGRSFVAASHWSWATRGSATPATA